MTKRNALLALGVAVLMGLLANSFFTVDTFINLQRQQSEISGALEHQTANRTANVATWCGAIDGLQHQLLGYLARVSAYENGLHPNAHYSPSFGLTLHRLDCKRLETKTTHSAKG